MQPNPVLPWVQVRVDVGSLVFFGWLEKNPVSRCLVDSASHAARVVVGDRSAAAKGQPEEVDGQVGRCCVFVFLFVGENEVWPLLVL